MAKQTLEEQIKKNQEEVWNMASLVDIEQMKVVDQIFERGLVMTETECLMNLFRNDSDEIKKDYLLVLNEMRKFYKKMAKHQQVELVS